MQQFVCVCVVLTEGGDKSVMKTSNDKNRDNWFTGDRIISGHTSDDNELVDKRARRCRTERDKRAMLAPSVWRHHHHHHHHDAGTVMYTTGEHYVCDCDLSNHYSVNTSLYPMIGSCTTSSCHVDRTPRPPGSIYHCSTSTLTDCSTCRVYEYAMDSVEVGPGSSIVNTSDATVDCSAALKAASSSLSWSTVHSAPAVLGRLTRCKQLPVSHSSVYNCSTTIRHVHDRRAEFCCYPDAYTARYQPRTYKCAAADDDEDDDDDDGLFPASLGVARPVLAATQYWV